LLIISWMYRMGEFDVYYHITPVQIRFNDIDIMGHVNNAVHQYYFDIARLQYFRHVFGKSVDWNKEALVLATITIDYLEPIKMEDRIEVHTRVDKIGNKSIGMTQRIIDSHTGALKSSSRSVLVAYSRTEHKTMEVPSSWRERVAYYDQVKI
jgi:acyl-CoA thioester hydrolase